MSGDFIRCPEQSAMDCLLDTRFKRWTAPQRGDVIAVRLSNQV